MRKLFATYTHIQTHSHCYWHPSLSSHPHNSKLQAQFQSMEVRNSCFAAFIDIFTPNTYVMVIVSDSSIRELQLSVWHCVIYCCQGWRTLQVCQRGGWVLFTLVMFKATWCCQSKQLDKPSQKWLQSQVLTAYNTLVGTTLPWTWCKLSSQCAPH